MALQIRILCCKEKALEFRVLWLLKKDLPSREEPDISLSILNSKACLHLLYTRITVVGGCLFTQSHADHMIGLGQKVIDEGKIMC